MKKYLFGLVIILTLSIIAILPAKGYARWVLYDDFNYEDGIPDPDLWVPYSFPSQGPNSGKCEERSPEIYVEDGKLVFKHYPEAPDCSRWLRIKNIGKAKAVRVTVRFEGSCSGDVRGRLGAVIGRQFSYDLLHAVSQLDGMTLQRELGRLVDAELVYQRGLPPQATYLFKHALVVDAAYESLLKSMR